MSVLPIIVSQHPAADRWFLWKEERREARHARDKKRAREIKEGNNPYPFMAIPRPRFGGHR